jgi:hypothetical protein
MVKSLYIGGLLVVLLFMIITGSKTIEGRRDDPRRASPSRRLGNNARYRAVLGNKDPHAVFALPAVSADTDPIKFIGYSADRQKANVKQDRVSNFRQGRMFWF